MTFLKAGTLLALAFAAGGGTGVYWTSSDSKRDAQDAAPPAQVIEVSNSTTRATRQDEQDSMPRSGEEFAEEHPHARSAADILWAMEQAYQDQEQRIRLLEVALEERIQNESEGEESGDEAQALLQAPSENDVVEAEVAPTPMEPVAHRHEPQVVVHIHEADEPAPAQANPVQENPAVAVAQQVVVVNHYQPVFMSDQLWTQSLKDIRSDARGFDPSAATNRPGQNSWVASGFDIYSRPQTSAFGQSPLFQRSTVRQSGTDTRTR